MISSKEVGNIYIDHDTATNASHKYLSLWNRKYIRSLLLSCHHVYEENILYWNIDDDDDDNDGIPDEDDMDDDGDGIPDHADKDRDSDGDGIPDAGM